MAEPAEDLEDTVRRSDPDRWLAARFIGDPGARADVIALYAFDHVLARVPYQVSEPLMGEIRLTWWREVLDEIFGARAVRGHPAALGLAQAVRGRGLDRAPLEALIDARVGDVYGEPLADAAAVLAYADDTAGALMQTATQALGAPAGLEAAKLAGRAYGLGVLAHRRAIGGKTRLPEGGVEMEGLVRDALRQAGPELKGLSVGAFPAVAYAALARRYVRGARLTPLEKQLRLVWATATGAL